MKREKQLAFQLLEGKNAKYFGGAYLKNSNPKEKRPISTKRSMHLVMRSSKARANLSFLKHNRRVHSIVATQAKAFGVKVYRFANASNHLHMIVLPISRKAFQGFVRAISGLIARVILGAERGSPKLEAGEGRSWSFWDKRPFTRVVEWGRDFRTTTSYLLQNSLEALGFIPYQPREIRFVGI